MSITLNKESFNWYGVNHDKMRELYGDLNGELHYVGTFTLEDDNLAFAVYRAPKPDKSKGHKEFVMLYRDPLSREYYITGRTRKEMTPYLTQDGVMCPACKEAIYSVIRHDMHYCGCGKTFVDGGRAYNRTTLKSKPITIDFLTNTATLHVSK